MTILGAVVFMAQLDFFIINVALDGIGKSFTDSPESLVSWVLSAYAVAFAAVLVPAGRQAAGTRLPNATSGLALLFSVSLLVLATVEGPE